MTLDKISLWKIFLVFAKLGAITVGGGYVMIPAIEDEMRRHHWIDDDELPDIVALSQSAPGLLTVNMAIFTGSRLRGVPGSIAATLGAVFAPFLVILGIAVFFRNFGDNQLVAKILAGVRPAAVALIAGFFIKLLRSYSKPWQLCITTLVFLLVVFFRISAVYVILAALAASAVAAIMGKGRARK